MGMLLLSSAAAADWPIFRGPDAARVTGEVAKTVPTDFDGGANKHVLWKVALPLRGESSPILIGDKVLLTGGNQNKRSVYCLNAETGKMVWQTDVELGTKELEREPMPDTGYAAPTPASDGRHVVVAFANGDIAGLDLAGKILWSRNLGIPESAYGFASSPAVDGGRAIIQYDIGEMAKENKSRLYCIETATGKTVWETPRPVPNSWASPLVVKHGEKGERQIVTAGDPWAIGYDADTGKELWRAKCLGVDTASTPAVADGVVFVCANRMDLTAISLDARGEVTKAKRKWKSDDVEMPECASPVANGQFVFTAADNGLLGCFDFATGETLWDEDIGTETKPVYLRSSPMIVGAELWIFDREGTMHRFAVSKEFKKLGTASLGEKIDSQPAFGKGRMYVRGKVHLFSIGEK